MSQVGECKKNIYIFY